MEQNKGSFLDVRILFAIAIILAGVFALLDNFGHLDFHPGQWWPVIFVIIGLGQLGTRHKWSGVILILLGGLILLSTLDVLDFSIGDLWPLILVMIGVSLLRQGFWGNKGQTSVTDAIDLSFVLGGGTNNITSKRFQGGKVTAIMGGGKIDLRDADFSGDSVTIDVFAFWGGIEFIVPRNWQVSMQVTPILGGAENRASAGGEIFSGKRLIIRGAAIMGGVEVKN
jgi:predicted membrane protein